MRLFRVGSFPERVGAAHNEQTLASFIFAGEVPIPKTSITKGLLTLF